MLTKKHFETIANIIAQNTAEDDRYVEKEDLIKDLCSFFGRENPKFDHIRFQFRVAFPYS